MYALQAVLEGDSQSAMIWLLVTQVIDGVDGPIARAINVRGRLPKIDGYVLDLVIDYATCVVVPAAFIYRFGLLPGRHLSLLVLAVVVLSAAIWFARTDMMTDDHWFRGFPATWNMVAISMFLLDIDGAVAVVIVLCLAAASFTNWPVPHPVQVTQWRSVTVPVTVVWLLVMTVLVISPSRDHLLFDAVLYIAPLYFLVVGALRLRQDSLAVVGIDPAI